MDPCNPVIDWLNTDCQSLSVPGFLARFFGLMPSVEKTLARYGIYSDSVATTSIAGGVSLTRCISSEYGEVLQTIIEAGYQQFLTPVAEGRDMDVEAVHEVAQRRIWTGTARRLRRVQGELALLANRSIECAAGIFRLPAVAR